MAQQLIDDRSLLEALFDVFRSRGYEGATLALLSEVTGLKKSSLYHRFPAGKEDMVKAVIGYISQQIHEFIVTPLLNRSTPVQQRFDEMLTTLKSFYQDGKKNCLLNVLSLDGAKPEIKSLMQQDYHAWLAALVELGMEAGLTREEAQLRAEHFLIVVEGALVVQRLTERAGVFHYTLAIEKSRFFAKP